MALHNSTKYTLLNLVFIGLLYAGYQYYNAAMSQPSTGDQAPRLILTGIILYAVISFVIISRAYYRRWRTIAVEESERGSELRATGRLATRLHKITLVLDITPKEFEALQASGRLAVAPERFNMPIRYNDHVEVQTGHNAYQRHVTTVIRDIDGYNQQVILISEQKKQVPAATSK